MFWLCPELRVQVSITAAGERWLKAMFSPLALAPHRLARAVNAPTTASGVR
jgi:hypothetical protein